MSNLSISTRAIAHNFSGGQVVGTVVGFDKYRKPIVCDDADGFCVVDYEHSFMALPTPKELLIVVRSKTRLIRTVAVRRIKGAFDALLEAMKLHLDTAKRHIALAKNEYQHGLALYYGV